MHPIKLIEDKDYTHDLCLDLVIALIVLLLFGGTKIPELMRGLGKGVKSFKEGMREIDIDTVDEKKKDGQ